MIAPEPCGTVVPGLRPEIAVVIAAYQAAGTIGSAVRSALSQEPPPSEVIVVDDGSTDDLAGALAEFGEAVRLIRIEHGGESAAKNAGMRAVRSEYVALLDADDLYLPGRLAILGDVAARRPDLAMITTDAYLELNGRYVGRCYHEGFRFVVHDQRRAMLQGNFVFGHVVARRDRLLAAGGFDEGIRFTADWECWIRVVLAGGLIGLVDEPLAVYRMHESAMSASREAMYEGRVATLTKTLGDQRLEDPERDLVLQTIRIEEARLCRERARIAILRGDPDARTRSMVVARSADQSGTARLKALATVLAPGLVRRRLRRVDTRSWVGVGDVRYPRAVTRSV